MHLQINEELTHLPTVTVGQIPVPPPLSLPATFVHLSQLIQRKAATELSNQKIPAGSQ